MLVPRKFTPSNPKSSTMALTGVCYGIVDVSVNLGKLPKIKGKFLKRMERQGYCGSPMILS